MEKQELEEALKRTINTFHNTYISQWKEEHKDILEDFIEEKKKLALTARGIDKKVMWKRLVGEVK